MTSPTKQQSKKMNNNTNNKSSKAKLVSVTAPVAKATKAVMGQPQFKSLANGNIRVKHSEYISEVFGSVNFNATRVSIQPGFQNSFPWLSLMAPLYESYVMKNLKYSFLTEKSTLTNGAIMMAVDYDVQDATPLNKQALMSYSGATRSAPWSDCHYSCNEQAMKKFPERFVRVGTVTNADLKTFDIGTFFIATQGNADTSVLGELHVSYEIEFRTPQLDSTAFAALGSSSSTATLGISGSKLLGTFPILNVAPSGLPLTYDTTTGLITFGSPGTYLVSYYVVTTANTSGTASITMTGGSTVSSFVDQSNGLISLLQFTVNVLNATDVMTITGYTIPAGTFARLRVSSFPFGI
jgi:hypothetical protein